MRLGRAPVAVLHVRDVVQVERREAGVRAPDQLLEHVDLQPAREQRPLRLSPETAQQLRRRLGEETRRGAHAHAATERPRQEHECLRGTADEALVVVPRRKKVEALERLQLVGDRARIVRQRLRDVECRVAA